MQWAVIFGHTYLLIKPEWPWKVIREFGLLPFIRQVVMAFGERSVLLGARWWWTFLLLHVWHSVTKGKCYHIFLTSVQTLPPHSSHHFVSWIETFLFFRTFLKNNTVSVISEYEMQNPLNFLHCSWIIWWFTFLDVLPSLLYNLPKCQLMFLLHGNLSWPLNLSLIPLYLIPPFF